MKKVVAFSIIALELVICHALIFEMPGFAQARQSLSSMRVIYNTQKATVRPQGALKEKIDALDREIAEAQRLGRTGAMRGLFAKGIALLAGREWTDELEFPTSLVVRSEQVCVDSNIPYAVRLEQS